MKAQKVMPFGLVLLLLAGCQPQTKENPTAAAEEKNKASMMKVADAFNSGNTEGLENYVAADMIENSPDPMIKTKGLEGLKETIATYRGAFPDLKMTPISVIADGDLVISHFTMTGTNTGPMGTMPATNKAMDVRGVDIVRFVDGKGAEHWGYYEESKMMMQLGLMPAPGDGAPK